MSSRAAVLGILIAALAPPATAGAQTAAEEEGAVARAAGSDVSQEEAREQIRELQEEQSDRQRLIECRDRENFDTETDESRRECERLQDDHELFIDDDRSLEERSGGDGNPSNDGGELGGPGISLAPLQRVTVPTVRGRPAPRGDGIRVTCRNGDEAVGECRVSVEFGTAADPDHAFIAYGAAPIGQNQTVTVVAPLTESGMRLLRKRPRIRARVIVEVPGIATTRVITLQRR